MLLKFLILFLNKSRIIYRIIYSVLLYMLCLSRLWLYFVRRKSRSSNSKRYSPWVTQYSGLPPLFALFSITHTLPTNIATLEVAETHSSTWVAPFDCRSKGECPPTCQVRCVSLPFGIDATLDQGPTASEGSLSNHNNGNEGTNVKWLKNLDFDIFGFFITPLVDFLQQVTHKLCLLMYKCLYGLAPDYLDEIAGRSQLCALLMTSSSWPNAQTLLGLGDRLSAPLLLHPGPLSPLPPSAFCVPRLLQKHVKTFLFFSLTWYCHCTRPCDDYS